MAHQNPEWSANTTAFFDLWKNTLHQNCKDKKKCTCHEAAYGLTVNRLECIERGMPDLHPDGERVIWSTAFDIHQSCCYDLPGWSDHIINPTWANPKDKISSTRMCDCFEKAMWLHQFVDENTPGQKQPEPIPFV